MAATVEEERAIELARSAGDSIKAGKLSDAARALREAASIAPEQAEVKAGFEALKQEEDSSPLLSLCSKWLHSREEEDGEAVLDLIRGKTLSIKDAEGAFAILTDFKGEDDVLDHVTGILLVNPGAQALLVKGVMEHPTQTYYELFERGDDSIDSLLKVLLQRPAWPSDEAFIQGHRDCFMLSLAMMMEEALEHPERAMKGVATLLAAHAEHLKGIIDADSFDVILSSLDIRLPNSLRSQATLATIKLFELAPETAQGLINKFVTDRVTRSTADGLVVAFSAAAAIFPITTASAAALFLTEGFVSSLPQLVRSKKSSRLVHASLELVSQACMDKTCREAVNRHCREWLEEIAATEQDRNRSNLAALVLVKLGEEPASDGPQIIVPGAAKVDQDDLLLRFKSMVISSSETGSKKDPVEGLAFASLKPKVRETLANDPKFLRRLIETLKEPQVSAEVLFGGLTILTNLTAYLPLQSEEEKRMAELKAYAATRKPTEPDPLLDEAHVTARCKHVLDAGTVPVLVSISKKGSPAVISHALQIVLSLSSGKLHRGTLAQQGAVKLLVQVYDHITTTESSPQPSSTPSFPPTTKTTAAQALARILISINPSHLFNSALPSTSAIRPLFSLLTPTEASSWQLHAFESLLALTNLASLDTPTQDTIIRTAFDTVNDDLLLSSNSLVRRAAAELICNLMASPLGIEKFADGSPRANQRLQVLLAITDVDDEPTRSAAGGALAMLLSFDEAVEQVLNQAKGVDYLLNLCRDENEDVKHRGVVCVRSIIGAEGEVGDKAMREVRERGGVDVLKGLLKESRRQEVLALGVETLKILLGQE
ncbi:CRO1 protein [Aaosphaeria arxii CBS 175.79]|uniref:CRO1 protein n=1 Tax=Aaosphaeria arxii CBS 175.79 TaxID=1450172 RepID=A0A6A5Y1Y9_9PLEO|nr:CRO1 protein [Aaosphaeria arxii CBS 175.79]KAF2018840.1 CRO1 protein [Aaosphaeria arxii CBS 175.79]